MNPFRTGKLVLFQVTYDRDWHFFEVLFFVVLGIFGVRGLLTESLSCRRARLITARDSTELLSSNSTYKWPRSAENI